MDRADAGRRFERLGGAVAWAKRAVPPGLRPRLGRFEPQYTPRPLSVPARYLRVTPPSPPPLISIVTPTLNQGPYIGSTLASIAQQRYPRLQYIVADGGSEDGTLEILDRYRELIDELETGPDDGQIGAINRALDRARGDILGWLNSDDLLLPGALAYVARFFVEHPGVDLVYGYRVLIDERGDDVGIWAMPPHSWDALRWVDLVPQETAFWRRDLWRRLGGVRPEFDHAFDWDFFRRAHAGGARIVRLPRFLGAQRQHGAQKSRAGHDRSLADQATIVAREERETISKAEVRGRLLAHLLASLPYQYLHRLRARVSRSRVPVAQTGEAPR